LRPLTHARPKPIVPLLNIPFLAYQLALLKRHGVHRAVLSCSHMVDEVRRAMGDGSRFGVELVYAVEETPLGTAGGVRNAADLVRGRVVVLNGDILTDADITAMLRFHTERGARASIYLTPVEDPGPYGLVDLAEDARVRRFIEKPAAEDQTVNTINAGIYVLDAPLLERIPPARVVSIEREFFPALVADGVPFFGWVASAYWLDIGNPEKYRQAQLDLLAGRVTTDVMPHGPGASRRWIAEDVTLGARVEAVAPVVIGAGSRLEEDCRVGPAAVLGPGCQIGRAASVTGAVLWERVSVGAGAVLRDCVVGAGARIGAHAQVGPGVVLEDGAVVLSGARLAR
jgi:mannose-1-phosphate guanylyltransferase